MAVLPESFQLEDDFYERWKEWMKSVYPTMDPQAIDEFVETHKSFDRARTDPTK